MADEDYILVTETQNENSMHIDKVDTIDALRIMNNEDKKVAYAVEKSLDDIALAVDKIVERMQKGGRLLYFGAGTSGRLAILDAAECPPTFGTDPEMVQGIMAGGKDALSIAKEDMEDHKTEGILEAEKNRITEKVQLLLGDSHGLMPLQ
jgi:N-acetylmuramic acid 6-phosphate etherase